jgi:hypothetical protein
LGMMIPGCDVPSSGGNGMVAGCDPPLVGFCHSTSVGFGSAGKGRTSLDSVPPGASASDRGLDTGTWLASGNMVGVADWLGTAYAGGVSPAGIRKAFTDDCGTAPGVAPDCAIQLAGACE